jgi:hypothetical protein
LRIPTRLIDVGKKESKHVFLCKTATWTKQKKDGLKYIALSHRWGDPEHHDHFSTTSRNINDRLEKGIAVDELPDSFKHAVEATRELDVPFLWIDSLCIIQGDDGDFKDEAKNMETVYNSAYCVMAASRLLEVQQDF